MYSLNFTAAAKNELYYLRIQKSNTAPTNEFFFFFFYLTWTIKDINPSAGFLLIHHSILIVFGAGGNYSSSHQVRDRNTLWDRLPAHYRHLTSITHFHLNQVTFAQ